MKKITVLFLGCVNDNGGAPKSMVSMISNLVKLYKIIPIVISPLNEGILYEFCKSNNIEYHAINYQEACTHLGKNFIKNTAKKTIKNILKSNFNKIQEKALESIDTIIKNKQIDIIHTNINRVTLGNLISKKYNIPQIIHIREFGKEDYNLLYYDKNIIEDYNNNCVNFIAISDSVKDSWIKRGIDKNKIITIYNGIDNLKTNNDKKVCYNNKINAIFCGTIIPSKGQFQVIKAIEKLPKEIKNIFHIDFYGEDKYIYPKFIKKYLKIKKLEKNVSFKGYVKDIENKMSSYNLGFICSKKEGFGRVTIEYMINNIPVIASNRGANIEIIRHRENGFLYEYNNIDDLCNKIIEVYNSKKIDKIIENAKNDVIDKFSASKNAEEIYNLYKSILTR